MFLFFYIQVQPSPDEIPPGEAHGVQSRESHGPDLYAEAAGTDPWRLCGVHGQTNQGQRGITSSERFLSRMSTISKIILSDVTGDHSGKASSKTNLKNTYPLGNERSARRYWKHRRWQNWTEQGILPSMAKDSKIVKRETFQLIYF